MDQDATWGWDGSDSTLLSPLKSPAAREQLGTVWDPASNQFLVFGGDVFNSNTFFGDTYALIARSAGSHCNVR